jgi:hypothetical protein
MSVLNIVELQNVVTSVTGTSAVGNLTNQVNQMQKMVIFDQKRINVNILSNYDATPIQVVSPINFSNVAVTGGGGGTSASGFSSIMSGTSELQIQADGGLYFTQISSSTLSITSSGNAIFTGSVSASNFITLSDGNLKKNIRPITNYETILSFMTGVHFQWNDSGENDVGLIAQDVQAGLPEAVAETTEGLKVSYMKLVPVLIQAVKSLQERVSILQERVSILEKERGFNNS